GGMGGAAGGAAGLVGSQLRGHAQLPLRFLDVPTLKEAPLESRQGGGHVGSHPQYPPTVRVSADGRVLGMWHNLSPSGLQTVVLSGNTAQTYHQHTSVGAVVPGPDGKFIFTRSGMYTPELKPVGSAKGDGPTLVPAVHGAYYLAVTGGDKASVAVHMTGDARPLVTLPNLEGVAGTGYPDKQLFLIPQARLLVAVPPGGDTVHVHPFDLDAALDKAGIDF